MKWTTEFYQTHGIRNQGKGNQGRVDTDAPLKDDEERDADPEIEDVTSRRILTFKAFESSKNVNEEYSDVIDKLPSFSSSVVASNDNRISNYDANIIHSLDDSDCADDILQQEEDDIDSANCTAKAIAGEFPTHAQIDSFTNDSFQKHSIRINQLPISTVLRGKSFNNNNKKSMKSILPISQPDAETNIATGITSALLSKAMTTIRIAKYISPIQTSTHEGRSGFKINSQEEDLSSALGSANSPCSPNFRMSNCDTTNEGKQPDFLYLYCLSPPTQTQSNRFPTENEPILKLQEKTPHQPPCEKLCEKSKVKNSNEQNKICEILSDVQQKQPSDNNKRKGTPITTERVQGKQNGSLLPVTPAAAAPTAVQVQVEDKPVTSSRLNLEFKDLKKTVSVVIEKQPVIKQSSIQFTNFNENRTLPSRKEPAKGIGGLLFMGGNKNNTKRKSFKPGMNNGCNDNPNASLPQKRKFQLIQKIYLVRRIVNIFEQLNILRRFGTVPELFYTFFGDKACAATPIIAQSSSSSSNPSDASTKQQVATVTTRSAANSIGGQLASRASNIQHATSSNRQSLEQPQQQQHQNISGSGIVNMMNSRSRLILFEDSKWVIALKILVIICCMIQCISIPLEAAFSTTITSTTTDSSSSVLIITASTNLVNLDWLTGLIPALVFLIDIYVNFHLAFYSKGKLVCDRREIAVAYFYGAYWFDLASIVLALLSKKSLPALVVRIYVFTKELERVLCVFQVQEKFYYAYRLINLVADVLLSCHVLASLFILVSTYDTNSNWVQANELTDASQASLYVNSLYFIIVTMATIGYGDIHPVSIHEKIFFCVIGFVSSAIFAYNISIISSIVHDSIVQKNETKKLVMSVTEYMTERSISRSIQNQILHQLHYNHSMEKNSPLQIMQSLKHVSENLKGSLFNEYYGKILQSNKYLKRKFSRQFLGALIPNFREEVFAPGSEIFSHGDLDDRLIYLRKGTITLSLPSTEQQVLLRECNEGEWLCQEDLFTGDARTCSAKNAEFTSIVFITRKSFLHTLQSFPRDQEVFHMIKDKVRLSNVRIDVKCTLCNSEFHSVTSCPFLHFTKKKDYIISKHNYSLTSSRVPTWNRRTSKSNALFSNDFVRYQLKNFRMTQILLAEGLTLFEERNNNPLENSLLEASSMNGSSSKRVGVAAGTSTSPFQGGGACSKFPTIGGVTGATQTNGFAGMMQIQESKEDEEDIFSQSIHYNHNNINNNKQLQKHTTTPLISNNQIPSTRNQFEENSGEQQQLQHQENQVICLGTTKDSPVSFRFTHHSFCWVDENNDAESRRSNLSQPISQCKLDQTQKPQQLPKSFSHEPSRNTSFHVQFDDCVISKERMINQEQAAAVVTVAPENAVVTLSTELQQPQSLFQINSQSQLKDPPLIPRSHGTNSNNNNNNNISKRLNANETRQSQQLDNKSNYATGGGGDRFRGRQQQPPMRLQQQIPAIKSILNILPKRIETDEEFFAKYDAFEYSNGELRLAAIDNYSQFSYPQNDDHNPAVAATITRQLPQQLFNQYPSQLFSNNPMIHPSSTNNLPLQSQLFQNNFQHSSLYGTAGGGGIVGNPSQAYEYFMQSSVIESKTNKAMLQIILKEIKQIRQQQQENLQVQVATTATALANMQQFQMSAQESRIRAELIAPPQSPSSKPFEASKSFKSDFFDRQKTPSLGRGMSFDEIANDSYEIDLIRSSCREQQQQQQQQQITNSHSGDTCALRSVDGVSFGLGQQKCNNNNMNQQLNLDQNAAQISAVSALTGGFNMLFSKQQSSQNEKNTRLEQNKQVIAPNLQSLLYIDGLDDMNIHLNPSMQQHQLQLPQWQQQLQQQHRNLFQQSIVGGIKSGLYTSVYVPSPQMQSRVANMQISNLTTQMKIAKDRIEFAFFLAFERQNNWKAYFPQFNLNNLVSRFKAKFQPASSAGASKKRLKKEKGGIGTRLHIHNEGGLNSKQQTQLRGKETIPKEESKYRRLSELIGNKSKVPKQKAHEIHKNRLKIGHN